MDPNQKELNDQLRDRTLAVSVSECAAPRDAMWKLFVMLWRGSRPRKRV